MIGAGHNGLVAAIELAEAGLHVTVLEHAERVGGATTSSPATLPGFVHDDCAGFVPFAIASPAIQRLELERDGLRFVDPPHVMAHPFADGTALALEREVAATAVSLGSAGAAWERAMATMCPLAGELVGSFLSPLPPVRGPLRLAGRLRGDALEWLRRLVGSVEALGLELFQGDTRATAWLAGSAQHTGLPPATAGSGAVGFLLTLLGHSHGWQFPRGGMGSLSELLARRAERAGALIRCGATVAGIEVRSGRVAGVRLRGGERLPADAAVATVSAGALARLLPDGALPAALSGRLRRWRYGSGVFKLDYALSAPVPWSAAEARRAAVVHVAGELDELRLAAEQGLRGELPARPVLVVGQHSLYDPTRAPPGCHTLYVYAHVPSLAREPDERVAEAIEAQLERHAPGFSSIVLGRRLRSPAGLERENPSLVGGDLAGGSYELDQQLLFRPAPRMCRYVTPLTGLFVAGASVHPGGAVHGMSGLGAARALLRRRRLTLSG